MKIEDFESEQNQQENELKQSLTKWKRKSFAKTKHQNIKGKKKTLKFKSTKDKKH